MQLPWEEDVEWNDFDDFVPTIPSLLVDTATVEFQSNWMTTPDVNNSGTKSLVEKWVELPNYGMLMAASTTCTSG